MPTPPRSTDRKPNWRLACGFALLLSACGGGGGGADSPATPTPPEPVPVGDYQPLNSGDRWVYRLEDGALELQSVTGSREVQGRSATVMATVDVARGSVEETLYIKSANALTELPDSTDPVSVQIGDVARLLLPLRSGQSFVQVDKTLSQAYDVDGDGLADAMTFRSDLTVLGFENISVAAGNFSQCAHLRTVFSINATLSSNGKRLTVLTTAEEWLAPGVGLVRDSSVTELDGKRSASSARELLSFAVGGRKSDSRVPALIRSSPAAGATLRSVSELMLRFDKAMDANSLRQGGLHLIAPTGQAMPFTLQQSGDGSDVTVVPTGSLGSGRYTVKLGVGATDLIGNALLGQEWVFTLDQRAPMVVSSLPAVGAVDVALTSTVRLQFDEDLDPRTIHTGNVSLRAGFTDAVPIRVEMPDARTVLITPLQALSQAQRYGLVLAPSVADVLGNVVFNSVNATYFDTVQGRLSSPIALAGAAGRDLATGDFNGDGRSDLLTIVDDGAGDSKAFNLYLHNVTGGFDLPRRLEVAPRPSCYSLGRVLLADMNGDGRADMVATRGGCGVEVFYQGAGGGVERSVLLAGDGYTMLKLMDMNGDGRLDVVATAWGSDSVSLWLQRSDGSWAERAQFPLFNNGHGDLALGDLNGDGRPDIAVTTGQGDLTKALGITYQQADGSFGTPQYRTLSNTVGPSTLAVADLDGDGRADLLTSSSGMGNLWWFRQQADGVLAVPVKLAGFGEAKQLAVADLDGDGRKDIVIGIDGYNSFVGVLMQASDGSFSKAQIFRGSSPQSSLFSMVLADLNGDGRIDVALNGPELLRNLGASEAKVSALAGALQQRHAKQSQGHSGKAFRKALAAARLGHGAAVQ